MVTPQVVDAATIVAGVSVVIALAALGVSVWEGVENRRHSRLSVRPLLRIDCMGMRQPPISITLINSGVGPAIVKSFEVRVDGKPVDSSNLHPMDEALIKVGLTAEKYIYFTPWLDEAISPGERLEILKFPNAEIPLATANHIRAVLPRLRVHVRYCSIYEQHFDLVGGWC
jgi:hypothetical protein